MTDASKRKTHEFFAPLPFERGSIVRRKGEEQLVVFAVINRLRDRAASRPRESLFVDLKANCAGVRETGKISAEAVAQIHHGVDAKMLRQPARFFQSWNEIEVPFSNRAA